MLTHPTIDLLTTLGLQGMAKGFQTCRPSLKSPPCRTRTGSPSCSSAR